MPDMDKTTERQVSFVFPRELIEWLDMQSKEIGITRKALVIRILSEIKDMDGQLDIEGSPWRRVVQSIVEAMTPTMIQLMEDRKNGER